MIAIIDTDFSIDEVVERTRRPSMGAIVTFLGTVRDMTKGIPVTKLEFEADSELAVKELEDIRQEAMDTFGAIDLSIVHRVGTLTPNDNIVIIVVGAAHRGQAFKACSYAIEELKKRALIWKKEHHQNESHWVGGSES